MSDNKEQNNRTNSRRQLLKATVIGTGAAVVAGKSLPEQWSRPLVESVTLPAHAQTSLASVGGGLLLSLQNGSADEYIFDSLVPTANAGVQASDSMVTAECCCSGSDNAPVAVDALIEFIWNITEPLGGIESTPCEIRDVAHYSGTVPSGVATEIPLQNGPCFYPGGPLCRVTATMNGGECSGLLEFEWSGEIFSSPFVFDDPNCPINEIPACDQGTCVIVDPE